MFRNVARVDFCRIILYFAQACAFRSLSTRIWLFVGARTISPLVASRQRPAMVATLLGDPICATLTKFRPLVPYCCSNGKGREPDAASPANHIMRAFTLTAKLSALFGGSLLALFVAGLVVEDQRHFVACRASGASADACLLQINGR
jgi:hypothetical protein